MGKRIVLLTLILTGLAVAQTVTKVEIKEGVRYKLYRVNGDPIEGYVKELPNDYQVELLPGVQQKVPKTQVLRIEVVADRTKSAQPLAIESARRTVTDEEIAQILGSENIDLESLTEEEHVDLMAELEVDQESLAEMLRIAGQKARTFDTDHFVFVYTSDIDKARTLAGRLESVYDWAVKYMDLFSIPHKRPEAKLEIYFFGTYEEYEAYQTLNGFMEMGALGFYMRTVNRSAFFDMSTWPPVKRRLEEMKNAPAMERRKLQNQYDRWTEHMNKAVVQHEAAHHIHFNVGIFPKGGDLPRWMTEGLATHFEVPPGDVGAVLAAVNHMRLGQFRKFYGPKAQNLPWQHVKDVILLERYGNGLEPYVLGWALNQYFRRQLKEQYSKWMQLLADREDNWVDIDPTVKQKQFEEIFGAVDEAWVKKFVEYINSIQYRESLDYNDLFP